MALLRRVTLALAFTLAVAAQSADAQRAHTRQGFWFNGGLGVGSLGCDGCDSRTTGGTGNIALGGTVSQKVGLGGAINVWTKIESGVTLTMGAVTAAIRFYPSATGGFHLLGGLGIATADLEISGLGNDSSTGVAALVGLGWDIRVGTNISLTPFWNGVGMTFDGGDANFGQIGLGLTVH